MLAAVAAHGGAWLSETRRVVQHAADPLENCRRWTPRGDLRRNDVARLDSVGPDPGLESPTLRIRAADFRYLVVEMRAAVAAPPAPSVAALEPTCSTFRRRPGVRRRR
ncbi:MAG: hypothetical protein E6J75_13535 [Deltaproteobacteria bacterium]|nr:MAG: hypothetical protein E6J75_13535 [Deltaproteobacteria bacterium]